MKKILTLSALAVTAIMTGCGPKTENSAQDKAAAPVQQQTLDLEKMSFEDRASYVLGINMGENLDASSQTKRAHFNREQVAAGVSDALTSNKRSRKNK